METAPLDSFGDRGDSGPGCSPCSTSDSLPLLVWPSTQLEVKVSDVTRGRPLNNLQFFTPKYSDTAKNSGLHFRVFSLGFLAICPVNVRNLGNSLRRKLLVWSPLLCASGILVPQVLAA